MKIGRTISGVAAGVAVAALIATIFPVQDALAKRKRRGRGGPLRLIDVNVGSFSGVNHNAIIEFKFTSDVDQGTVGAAIFQIRGQNALGTGFTKQVPGSFQVQGNKVRFFPRLPTHMRDPDSPIGAFYPAGSERDNADENAGFQPLTNYKITVLGNPTPSPVRSTKGRPLNRTAEYTFTTSPIADRSEAFTIDNYDDAPPPGFQFSNPPDKVASVADQYAKHGGTQEVPNDIAVTLFGTKVPLAPSTVRKEGNVTLLLTERKGDPSLRKPVQGSTFVEQNFDSARLFFQPNFPLPDLGTYALRVKREVRDLTGLYDYRNNLDRLRLREVYEFLDTARQLSPGTPPEELQDPPARLIFDWPVDPVERGVLKANLLDLGDTYPDEIDPRVMVLFSTRDEPVSTGQVVLEFIASDGNNDKDLTTASYDEGVPNAIAAIMTIAGGSAADGDFEPLSNETINTDIFPENTINWRNLIIPPGVVVNLTGSRPATVKALSVDIQGELHADGLNGTKQTGGTSLQSPPSVVKGGKGGPGGGKGGDATLKYETTSKPKAGDGTAGVPGHDKDLVVAEADDGGRGGLGGKGSNGSGLYVNGGGGGGGGARLAGTDGATPTSSQASWRGVGGKGGAGSTNDDLQPLVGGAGGASGANGAYTSQGWGTMAGSGGGGGGAVLVQTASVFQIGTDGQIRARGGTGGTGSSNSAMVSGPGGGGGGGSLLLRTSQSFDFSDPTNATSVPGGAGGTQSAGSFGAATFGGTGGEGYVRLESPGGGIQVPGGTAGIFDPVGGGVQSFMYTVFIDVGVDDPRIVNFTEDNFVAVPSDDATLIEMQMAIEDPDNFGFPLLNALEPDEGTSNVDEVSKWAPVRYTDNTGGAEPAIPNIPGYNPATMGPDHIFDIAEVMNGKSYKFVRFRITFQLNDTQSSTDILPSVDRLAMTFQFNF